MSSDPLAKASTHAPQGVPSFLFDPAHARMTEPKPVQLGFLPPAKPLPLDHLQESLLKHFAGRSLTMIEVRQQYNRVEDHYLASNYKDALLRLEAAGRITVDPPAACRPAPRGELTFADWVRVTFPPRSD